MSEEQVPYTTELGEEEEPSFFPIDNVGLRDLFMGTSDPIEELVLTPYTGDDFLKVIEGLSKIKSPLYVWEPKEDITPFELAQCLPPLLEPRSFAVANLPPECQRHFREEEE